ncbi:MAG: ATP-binding protein, partial [Candidatus Omnitrophica bacterium]|nr:ATP-binding protein [Candidatus Omnitrophota bacterium]MBU1810585.1 ATP-binding protein [Candidatus Omnitrophota bacterium]
KKNIVFIGNPGTGKTHLSIAIGIRALKKGYKVLFTSVSDLLHSLNTAKADNSYYQKINFYLTPDLLILDELGFKKLPNYSADDFFEIISRRYEKGSSIITTNKPFEQWSDIFTDHILASAILDRIVHYSTIIKINGPSYRAKSLKKGDSYN